VSQARQVWLSAKNVQFGFTAEAEWLFTLSDLLGPVEVQVSSISMNDHFESFRHSLIVIEPEIGGDVVEQNWLFGGSCTRKEKKLNRVVSARLQILEKARAELKLPRQNTAEQHRQRDQSCELQFVFFRHALRTSFTAFYFSFHHFHHTEHVSLAANVSFALQNNFSTLSFL
jgi:hypothetical protein